jgi:uncharacterized protein (TIGR03067 family)
MLKRALLVVVAGLLVAADAKDDAAAKDLKKLQGTWVMVSGERDGEKVRDEDVKKSKITWTGDECAVETPHQSDRTIKGKVRLDPSKKPKEMDWERSAGPGAAEGKTFHAIYEFLDDDTYRICFAPPGKDRPGEFKTRAGTGHTLHAWKRVKP